MKMIDIQSQLRAIIPTLTDDFNDKTAIESAVVSSGAYTITATGHGLSVGDTIVINNVDYVHELTFNGKPLSLTASFTSSLEMDLYNNEKDTVVLRSDETYYDGEFTLKAVTDRYNFTCKVDRLAPSTTTDSIYIVESDLAIFNDEFTVASVPDADTFTIATSADDTTDLEGGQFYNVVNEIRINSTVDINYLLDNVKQYEGRGNWLFVSSADNSISRDRDLKTDAPQRLEQGMDIKIDTWENFSVFALINTTDTIDPVEYQDYCRNELRSYLNKSLVGFRPPSYTTGEYDYIYYDGDALLTFTSAFYVHQFNFGCTLKINSQDGFLPKSTLVKKVVTDYLKDEDVKATDTVTFTDE